LVASLVVARNWSLAWAWFYFKVSGEALEYHFHLSWLFGRLL